MKSGSREEWEYLAGEVNDSPSEDFINKMIDLSEAVNQCLAYRDEFYHLEFDLNDILGKVNDFLGSQKLD